MTSRILVPIDLQHTDRLTKALSLAAKVAQEDDATVVFAGIADAVPTASTKTVGATMAEELQSFAADQAKLHGIKVADHVGLRGDLHLSVGPDLIRVAKEAEADLIVMASHVPGLKDHFLSSNAGYVAAHAPVSVYVVR
ncbi:MAG: universal stress protein [Pseudomonadota bacterium]